mmetsp:Transcript_26728/g.46716  ORF Transcript_26728/g.46716 Transcript_26728/m.46716 type:complete len:250 (+) Transcript_26728:33-782(+)
MALSIRGALAELYTSSLMCFSHLLGSLCTGLRDLLGERVCVLCEPGPQAVQRAVAMADGILRVFCHLGVCLAVGLVWLEHGVPPKVKRTTRWHNLALRSTIEYVHLRARPCAQREDALRVRALVLVRRQHIVQAVVSALLEEPLDVRARQPTQRIEAQVRVLAHDRPACLDRGETALFYCDFLRLALQLRQVQLGICQRKGERRLARAQNARHFLELLGIARHECESWRGVGGGSHFGGDSPRPPERSG